MDRWYSYKIDISYGFSFGRWLPVLRSGICYCASPKFSPVPGVNVQLSIQQVQASESHCRSPASECLNLLPLIRPFFPLVLTAISRGGVYPSCIQVEAGSTPGWVASSSQVPMWAFEVLAPCSRVLQQCYEGVLAPFPATRTRPKLWSWTQNPLLLSPLMV